MTNTRRDQLAAGLTALGYAQLTGTLTKRYAVYRRPGSNRNWYLGAAGWIARGDGEYGWGAFLARNNDRISPICAAFVGASDGWTPRTAALALACVVCAARYAEEVGQDIFIDQPKGEQRGP